MKSNEQKREQLSALVDNELTHDISSAVDSLLKDDKAKKTWERYHIIGDSLRGCLPKRLKDISDNVTQAIALEPTVLAPRKKFSYFVKPVMGFAIAASVTVAVIFNIQQDKQIPRTEQSVVAQPSITTSPLSSVSSIANWQLVAQKKGRVELSQTRNFDLRLNRYLINYSEYRSNTNINGMLPHVRMVANGLDSSR